MTSMKVRNDRFKGYREEACNVQNKLCRGRGTDLLRLLVIKDFTFHRCGDAILDQDVYHFWAHVSALVEQGERFPYLLNIPIWSTHFSSMFKCLWRASRAGVRVARAIRPPFPTSLRHALKPRFSNCCIPWLLAFLIPRGIARRTSCLLIETETLSKYADYWSAL